VSCGGDTAAEGVSIDYIRNGGSVITTQRAFRIRFELG
jgi:hypothetical protein